jgi:hypothetical protein
MTSYLIPYLDPRKIEGHDDPMLYEYTYGESGKLRGGMLLNKVKKGDFLFFHTDIRGNHVITGYYSIEKSMLTREAKQDELIVKKYQNPHLKYEKPSKYDTITFGNVIYSKVLYHLFIITENLLSKLSRRPESISRPWVKLTEKDVQLLLDEIEKSEERGFLKDTFLSSSEVQQLLEEDIETFIWNNPHVLGAHLNAYKRQYILGSGNRLDVLLKDENKLLVVEIKKGAIGREAYRQVSEYMKEVKNEFHQETIGAIVCEDILPAFEDSLREIVQKGKIGIYAFSWKFNLRPLFMDSQPI